MSRVARGSAESVGAALERAVADFGTVGGRLPLIERSIVVWAEARRIANTADHGNRAPMLPTGSARNARDFAAMSKPNPASLKSERLPPTPLPRLATRRRHQSSRLPCGRFTSLDAGVLTTARGRSLLDCRPVLDPDALVGDAVESELHDIPAVTHPHCGGVASRTGSSNALSTTFSCLAPAALLTVRNRWPSGLTS